MTNLVSGGSGQSRRRRGIGPVASVVIALLGVLSAGLLAAAPFVFTAKQQPPAAASAPHQPSSTPGQAAPQVPSQLPSVVPVCFQHPVGTHFFANDPGREGPNSFGTSLVPPGLRLGSIPARVNRTVTRRFLERNCLDPVLATATLGTVSSGFNPSGGASRANVLSEIQAKALWNQAYLAYVKLPPGWWTYGMIPGHPPTLYAAQYRHGPSWFLVVPLQNGTTAYFRLKCGGQGVFPKAHRDRHIPLASSLVLAA